MSEHNLFYYPHTSFAQLPLLKVAALYVDKLYILRSGRRELGDHRRELPDWVAVKLLKDAGILQRMTPADVLARYTGPITNATVGIRRTGNFGIFAKRKADNIQLPDYSNNWSSPYGQ
jgi:hypothetical protein